MNFFQWLLHKDAIIPFEIQNKKNWSVLLQKYEEVPEGYKTFFEHFRQRGFPFPYSVFTPNFDIFGPQSADKVFSLIEDSLYVINSGETPEKALRFKLDDIQFIRFKSVLLDSQLRIVGSNENGGLIETTFRFNSVSDHLFKKVINLIRQYSFEHQNETTFYSFDEFRKLNFKFANFAQHCLLAGENVVQVIWQPELIQPTFRICNNFFAKSIFRHRLFSNHVCILTDQELIVISEDNQYAHEDRYGGIWDYIPLAKILVIKLSVEHEAFLSLEIQLHNNQLLEYRFSPSRKTELESVIRYCNLSR